ncbi:MAG: protein-glutamate O-methyltransferase CheR [Planctomycetales bacterium]|nr:protein-glutamate O-methyltransferase CheR [Planctomycetales bacterium]
MQITPNEIDAVCDLIHDLCGIYLDESKAYLIENRLADIVKKCQCSNYLDLVRLVREQCSVTLKQDIVNAITTQETLFFRDGSPFEALKNKALPEMIDSKASAINPKRLRMWSAACSSGQEPYSIAMTICELIPSAWTWDIQILATDISDSAIAKASRGRYAQYEVERGLPNDFRDRYFTKHNEEWIIKDEIRSMVAFRRLNLHEPFETLGPFDIIFCRNVAIYFTPEQRRSLFERLSDRLVTNGYLFVGSSESLSDYGERFQPLSHCRSVFYQPNVDHTQGARSGS